MKSRFSTIDIAVIVQELRRFLSMRVVNVYDIDNKTYLIRVGKPDEKDVILIESGIRLHSTEFDWPKNPAPSGFSMKLRKHLKGRRFESIRQLGIDRIVDLQFGSNEAAYHVIVELYDRGNIVLTDFEYTILNILRPRTDTSQDVRFAVRETYPIKAGKSHETPTDERVRELLQGAKDGDVLKKVLVPHLDYGPAIIEHILLGAGFTENVKMGKGFHTDSDFPKLMSAILEAEDLLQNFMTKPCKGYIVQKRDKKSNSSGGEPEEIFLYDEFHPLLFRQHHDKPTIEFTRFDRSVDEFFSKLESQRLDMKVIQQEKNAMKKLDNVKKDHEKRIQGLQKEQESDILRGQLIEINLDMVDQAILIVRSALANQIDWTEIWNLVKEAQLNGDPVARSIKVMKLDTNLITLLLSDPYVASQAGDESGTVPLKPMRIDIDLGTSAYGNSRRYFDMKKQAAKKQQKTVEASNKAFKSAEKKTKQTLKDVATAASINKTRRTYWFEKFLWFISSENYLVIGGRDQQQNDLIVKRYMKPGDLYVHADLHGASSCVIKNPSGVPVPPKTLNEAGTMAICNSAAWDSKVVTSAWWVYHDQVSKTAPSGEYLTTGSFMIRGKKNFLPPSYLVYGFGFIFKLEDGSIERHLGERKVRTADDMSVADSIASSSLQNSEHIEIEISDDSDDNEDEGDATSKCGDDTETAHVKQEGEEKNEAVLEDIVVETTDGGHATLKEEEKVRMRTQLEPVPDDDDLDSEFPDTSITLQHVKGDKYELHRDFSHSSSTSGLSDVIHFGDGVPVVFGVKTSSKSAKLSAKQRRVLKKGKKPQQSFGGEEEDKVSWLYSDNQDGGEEVKDDNEKVSGLHRDNQDGGEEGKDDKEVSGLYSDNQDGREEVKDDKEKVSGLHSDNQDGGEEGKDDKEKVYGLHSDNQDGVEERKDDKEKVYGLHSDNQDGMEERKDDKEKVSGLYSDNQNGCEEGDDKEKGVAPPKRGQKAKLKKMKEKYAYQDDEERRLRMEILASAGAQKEEKKKKGKKGKEKQGPRPQKPISAPQPKAVQVEVQGQKDQQVEVSTEVQGEELCAAVSEQVKEAKSKPSTTQDAESDGEKEEETTVQDDTTILNSLSGLPVPEDELLFAIPMCAPYNAILNYKFKVKLMPGSTKRGKAVKTALNMFVHEKSASLREKNLLKIQKDVDLSRNVPGKVKVAAPNLHKGKR